MASGDNLKTKIQLAESRMSLLNLALTHQTLTLRTAIPALHMSEMRQNFKTQTNVSGGEEPTRLIKCEIPLPSEHV